MDSVYKLIDYGNVKCNLKKIMEDKGITQTQLVKSSGVHSKAIINYCNNEALKYDADILARLCFVLKCDINDLLVYIPPTKKEELN